jgi:hypothetical protein
VPPPPLCQMTVIGFDFTGRGDAGVKKEEGEEEDDHEGGDMVLIENERMLRSVAENLGGRVVPGAEFLGEIRQLTKRKCSHHG